MPLLRPLPMAKVGVVGLTADRDRILQVLHDLHVLQVEPIGKAALEHLSVDRSPELQRTVADQLVRVRGLVAALPVVEVPERRRFPDVAAVLEETKRLDLDEEVGRLKREEESLRTERAAVSDTLEIIDRFAFYQAPYSYLTSKSLLAFFGEAPTAVYERIRSEVPALSNGSHFVEHRGEKSVQFLIAVPTAEAEAVGRLAQQRGVRLLPAPRLSGGPAEERPRLTAEAARLEARLGEIRERLAALAGEWSGILLPLEEALAIENRKLELYPKFGVGHASFAVEGWLPKRDRPRLESALEDATGGRTLLYDVPTSEVPPTFLENPPGVRWFEFFIRFYSIPQANEWDPTLTFAVVFPILFGFMLGDVGYGAVILGISLWMIAGFPGRRGIPRFIRNIPKMVMPPDAMRQLAYALVPGCLVGIAVGVLTNSYFGFSLGYTELFSPLRSTGQLLLFAAYLGVAMVVWGFLLGALKEYAHGRSRHAVGKVGGILASFGLAGAGLALLRGQLNGDHLLLVGPEVGLLVGGILMMLYGEGVVGMGLGFIEVLSHILSFTRLVGILLASVILALVINNSTVGSGGSGLVFSHNIGWVVFGAVILVVGQVFNLILGVFEPGIQGMRLMFVEHFSKFYDGSGKPFQPFGTRRKHTEAPSAPT